MKRCVICNKDVLTEDAPLLSISAYGTPKFLCDTCSFELDTATLGKEYADIVSAMDRIAGKISDTSPDKNTLEEVNQILESAAKRAKKIKDGSYDFALDEEAAEDEDSFDEVPEDLKETEEDKALDRRDEERAKKFDRIFNWILWCTVAAASALVIWRILDAFLF